MLYIVPPLEEPAWLPGCCYFFTTAMACKGFMVLYKISCPNLIVTVPGLV